MVDPYYATESRCENYIDNLNSVIFNLDGLIHPDTYEMYKEEIDSMFSDMVEVRDYFLAKFGEGPAANDATHE